MKPRRVVLTIEVETDIPLKNLRNTALYKLWIACQRVPDDCLRHEPVNVEQISANVIREKRKGKR